MAFDAKTVGVRVIEAAVFAVLLWGFTGLAFDVLVGVLAGVLALGVLVGGGSCSTASSISGTVSSDRRGRRTRSPPREARSVL
ncbi:hypothetical protein U3A55_06775 [Salarchaeum sp. III]|uniref:hypothetical protein n=1 Tax=Salarchaeum sp. III TaxID=3107927 RepID=UPI002ED9E11E